MTCLIWHIQLYWKCLLSTSAAFVPATGSAILTALSLNNVTHVQQTIISFKRYLLRIFAHQTMLPQLSITIPQTFWIHYSLQSLQKLFSCSPLFPKARENTWSTSEATHAISFIAKTKLKTQYIQCYHRPPIAFVLHICREIVESVIIYIIDWPSRKGAFCSPFLEALFENSYNWKLKGFYSPTDAWGHLAGSAFFINPCSSKFLSGLISLYIISTQTLSIQILIATLA